MFAVKRQIYLAVSYTEAVSRINMTPLRKSQSLKLNDMIAAKEKKLAKIMRYKQALFEDWKDGEITRNDYRHTCEEYERQAATVHNALAVLKTEKNALENGITAENPFLTTFRKHENFDKLPREILIDLVEHIKVHEDGEIHIRFKFTNDCRKIAQYIEVNTHSKTI